MPREIRTVEDPNEVFRLSRERQIVEAQFARNVYQVFNGGKALEKLQGVAQGLMRMMAEGPEKALNAALKDEGNLRLWDKVQKSASGIRMWCQHSMYVRRLDATDCADVIRLAGAWVESGGLGGGPRARSPHEDARGKVKDAFRVGAGQVWGPNARVRDDGWDIEPHLVPHMRDQNAAFTGMAGVKGSHGKKASKRAARTSRLLQLDRLFGLIVACDISGTTADCVFALELLGNEFDMSAAYYMLPLGTIVHNMHHSLLEVALVVSLNGEMDYQIGFFDTLKPVRCGGFPPELAGLQVAITSADSAMRNQGLHHMRYYEGSSIKGAFQFQARELAGLKNSLISSSVTMLDRAQCLGGYPQRRTVVQLIESGGFDLIC